MTDAEFQEIGRRVTDLVTGRADLVTGRGNVSELLAEIGRLRNLLLSWDVCPDCGKFAERGECRCRD